MTDKRIEILAPAGSYAAFRAALSAGADAVYAGGPRFGARAYAENFTEKELIEAIKEAHLFERKFYLTVNTLLKDSEITGLYDYLKPLYETGLDAVIVQDAGVLEYIRSYFPQLDIHASTQMSVTGAYGASFLEEQGAVRVVPARELSLEEIRKIREKTGLEIECFVHGALCYCYSGQCLLSSMIGGRSGNRGQCAQPCRLPYTVDGKKGYFLSPKDICTLEIIPDLIESGIDSFKIEGRMKKPEYVAGVTSMYRKYTDLYLKYGRNRYHVLSEDRENLMDLYNRGGSSTGYYLQHNGPEMMASKRPNHSGIPAAKVISVKGRKIACLALTSLGKGDVIEISGGKNNYTTGKTVGKGTEFSFLTGKGIHLKKGAVLNRVRNESLISRLQEMYVQTELKLPVSGILTLCPGECGKLCVSYIRKDGTVISCTAETESVVQEALSKPMDASGIRAQIMKTGNTQFRFEKLDVHMQGAVFIPVSQLNLLRREALEGLRGKLQESGSRTAERKAAGCTGKETDGGAKQNKAPELSVLVTAPEQLDAVMETYLKRDACGVRRIYAEAGFFYDDSPATAALLENASRHGVQVCPAMPCIFRSENEAQMLCFMKNIKKMPIYGILIRNYEEYYFLKEQGFDKNIILDHNLYVFNRYGKLFWRKNGVKEFTASYELTAEELSHLELQGCDMPVYGRVPVMISAQCVKKNCSGCTGEKTVTLLCDRFQNRYPVVNCCDMCYNIIYDCRPMYLGKEKERILKLRPDMLRIQFSVESGEESVRILKMIKRDFYETDFPRNHEEDFGSGHFRKGIL